MPSNFKALAGAAGGGDLADPNFNNVTLLLHGDGSNGAQNNTFIDSSTNNLTITRNGNTTQGSFSPYGSNWSIYSDGTGDSLVAPANAAFAFGTGDFTIEFWAYIPSWTSEAQLIGAHTAFVAYDFNVQQWSSGQFRWLDSSLILQSGYAPPTNQWNHYAFTRSGTTLRIFVNGVQRASGTSTANIGSNRGVGMLGDTGGAQSQIGYMSNVRILKGTALYTSNFTPSTTPLTAITNTSLLTCAYNRFRDGSTNNFTITRNGDVKVTNFAPFAPSSAYSTSANGGSAYFDGNGDWLQAPNVTALQLGSSNFTIEGWVYLTSLASAPFFDQRQSGPSGQSFVIYVNSSGALSFYSYDPGWDYTSNLILRTNSWNHIAVVRNGNNATLYLNGVASSSTVNVSSYNNTSSANRIFNAFDPGYATGYLSDFRIVKGVAVYTTNFTPPTSPLTSTANTSLLLNGQNAAIFDNSMKNDLETVGNAQISTSVKKFGTGSMYFDGSGDYLRAANNDIFAFGTGDFTVEMWAYFADNTATNRPLLDTGVNSNTGRLLIRQGNDAGTSNVVNAFVSGTTVGSPTISFNQWTHVAVVRQSGTVKIYINGTGGTGVSAAADLTQNGCLIGAFYDQLAWNFTGYIDDLRITKGVARYTANFTAPTAPFPNK